MDMARPVRLGIAFGSTRVPRWQLDLLIELLQATDLCEVHAWVVPEGAAKPLRGGLFGLYERWDRRRFEEPGDALAPADIQLPPGSAPRADIDALIWLLDGPPPPASATPPTLGTWYLSQGAAGARRHMALAEEVRAGAGAVHTELRCRDAAGDRLLLGSVGAVDRVSLHRARTRAYARAARLPLRYLRRAAHGGAEACERTAAPPQRSRPLLAPRLLARVGWRICARKVQAQLVDHQWLVAYRRGGVGDFSTLASPHGVDYADPFPLELSGRSYLFFETFTHAGDGKIAATAIGDGLTAEPETVLEGDTHLSYPFLLKRGDDVLMVPESRRLRQVALWRAERFPHIWKRERTLLDHLPATDTTLFERDGRVWLFTAIAVDDGPAVDELHLFWADSLDGDWEPHPLNPVVSDVHRARPAGALFEHDGRLVRPAQDCSRAYGWRVVLNHVELLSQDDYREEPFAILSPRDRGLSQLHTYNVRDGWEAIDLLRRVPRGPLARPAPKSVGVVRHPYVAAASAPER